MRIFITLFFVSLCMISSRQDAIAVELQPCTNGTAEQKIECLNSNVALLNKTFELVTKDLRGRLDSADARIAVLENVPKPQPSAGWSIGCTNGVCAAINATGDIRFIDGSNFQLSGTGKLPGPVTGPVTISCVLFNGEQCWAIDAAAHVWRGNARAIGQPYDGPH
jgi:hypothetical protein